MKTIWKYKLLVEDEQTIAMPEGAEILTLQLQNREPHLWVLVDPRRPFEERRFSFYGIDHQVSDNITVAGNYIGAVQFLMSVFHLFEDK
jgi:hypothetical protein